jgi:hypothetical protein
MKVLDDAIRMVNRTAGFLDFFNHPVFLGVEARHFGNCICLGLQVKGGDKTPTPMGPLETANLNHWNPLKSKNG